MTDEEKLGRIEQERQKALTESNSAFDELSKNSQDLYDFQNNNANQYEQQQNDILDRELQFNESKIEQQKEEARKAKEVEEKKARNDYAEFINPYGYQNESLAERGLLNSGVSETSQLGGYNAYQNRLSSANKVLQDALTQYDNDINEARVNNDVAKAQNALAKLQSQMQFAENYYNNKSNITQNRLNANQSLDSEYNSRYQNELDRQESIRQYNEQMEFQRQQAAQDQANWEREYALSQAKNSSSYYGGLGSGYYGTSGSELAGGLSANGYGIIANPYTGTVNSDAQYGVFQYNESGTGYQPNNINGQKLNKTTADVKSYFGMTGNVDSGKANVDSQHVWELNGRFYIWDGHANEYVDVTGAGIMTPIPLNKMK